MEASDGVDGGDGPRCGLEEAPGFPGLADPTPNPTSRLPRRNPQYALQQPKSSQTLSEAESRTLVVVSRPILPSHPCPRECGDPSSYASFDESRNPQYAPRFIIATPPTCHSERSEESRRRFAPNPPKPSVSSRMRGSIPLRVIRRKPESTTRPQIQHSTPYVIPNAAQRRIPTCHSERSGAESKNLVG